jgi:hypothetical protein
MNGIGKNARALQRRVPVETKHDPALPAWHGRQDFCRSQFSKKYIQFSADLQADY